MKAWRRTAANESWQPAKWQWRNENVVKMAIGGVKVAWQREIMWRNQLA
jgi:hypothetical protein